MVTTEDKSANGGFGVLFGYPIAHSFSPFLHQAALDEVQPGSTFSLFESKDIPAFLSLLQDPNCYGKYTTRLGPHWLLINLSKAVR